MAGRDAPTQDSILLPGTPVTRPVTISEKEQAYRTHFDTQLQPEHILPEVFHNIEGNVVTPPSMAVDNSLNNYLRQSRRMTEDNSKINRINQFFVNQDEIPRLNRRIRDETIKYLVPDLLKVILPDDISNLMNLLREQYLLDYAKPVQETELQYYQRIFRDAFGNLNIQIETPIPIGPAIIEIPRNENTEPILQPENETNLGEFMWPNISAIDRHPVQGTTNYMEKYGTYRRLAVSCFKLKI